MQPLVKALNPVQLAVQSLEAQFWLIGVPLSHLYIADPKGPSLTQFVVLISKAKVVWHLVSENPVRITVVAEAAEELGNPEAQEIVWYSLRIPGSYDWQFDKEKAFPQAVQASSVQFFPIKFPFELVQEAVCQTPIPTKTQDEFACR